VVVATLTQYSLLSETELSQYCREKGLLVEQVKEWRSACVMGAMSEAQRKVTCCLAHLFQGESDVDIQLHGSSCWLVVFY